MYNGVININNVNYDCVYNYSKQLTIFSEVSIDCEINLLKNPEYKKVFVSLYENKSKLYIDAEDFIVEEAYIKAIRMNFNPFNLSMSMVISGINFRIKDKKDLRKEKIEKILKNDTSI